MTHDASSATGHEATIHSLIDVEASTDAVWRALTDAEELCNWFPVAARITPGVGGSVWVSWGEFEAKTPISVWEEGRRLKLVYAPATPPDQADKARAEGCYFPEEVASDYIIESRGNNTSRLRVVNSGFGEGSSWAGMYDATVRGWAFELRGLRHYLEHHRGTRRIAVHAKRAIDPLTVEQAWARLAGTGGLGPSINTVAPGDQYRLELPDGDVFAGEVYIAKPPQDLCATVTTLNNGLLRLRVDAACATQAAAEVNLWISTYGLPSEQTDALKTRLQHLLDAVLA